MSFVLHPWQLLLVVFAGWINRQQQEVIDYLCTENQILKESHGKKRIQPSTRKEFLKTHWDVLGATDFTTIEVWTKGELVTIYLLFVMEVGTRRVHFAGSTTNPTEAWMKQVARVDGKVECRERLGRLVRYYYRDAAQFSFRHHDGSVRLWLGIPSYPLLDSGRHRVAASIELRLGPPESFELQVIQGFDSRFCFLTVRHGKRNPTSETPSVFGIIPKKAPSSNTRTDEHLPFQ